MLSINVYNQSLSSVTDNLMHTITISWQLLHHAGYLQQFPPVHHLSLCPFVRPSPILTFRGIHSCWGHSVPLLPSSWSINLLMCASICVFACVCPSICAKVLIDCSCFFWVYTTGLCVCISRIYLCDSWGCM